MPSIWLRGKSRRRGGKRQLRLSRLQLPRVRTSTGRSIDDPSRSVKMTVPSVSVESLRTSLNHLMSVRRVITRGSSEENSGAASAAAAFAAYSSGVGGWSSWAAAWDGSTIPKKTITKGAIFIVHSQSDWRPTHYWYYENPASVRTTAEPGVLHRLCTIPPHRQAAELLSRSPGGILQPSPTTATPP